MSRSIIGAMVIAALALAACRKEDPARVAKPGEAVAERVSPGGTEAKPAGGLADPASPGGAAWVARGGAFIADEREYLAYARLIWPRGLEGKTLEERRGLAQRLLVRKAAAADAESRGFGNDPAVAREEMRAKFESYPELYWAETLEKDLRIDDQELRALFRPQTQHLLGAMVFGDDAAGERRAREVHRLLEAGGDFAALAREQSEGFLAAKGGDMEWATLPNFMIEAKEAAVIAATKPGAHTQPLQTRLGWTIFRVRERQDAETIFAARKEQELPGLLAQRREEAKARRIAELRARAAISYPAEQPGAPAGAPAALVNGYAFPAGALDPALQPHGGVQQSVTPPEQLLEKTIDVFLIVLETERLGLADRPEIKLHLALKRMDLLAQLLFSGGSKGVVVTEAEMREEHTRYYTPATYEFQIIVTDSRERAAEALRRARGGAEFAALAGEYNTGQLAQSKGLIPLGSTAMHPASVQAALPALADGEVSEVLDLGKGSWGVVKRLSQQFFPLPPFEQVSGQIRKRLELMKRAEQTLFLAEEYRKKLNISFNESLLAKR